MSRQDLILWVVVPYVCLAIFAVGHVWRYKSGRLTWTTKSTQLLERKLLAPGILLFHLGLLAAIFGHAIGLLIPSSVTESLGISEHTYHLTAVVAGGISGTAMTIGFLILLYRRAAVPRVRRKTTGNDVLTYAALGIALFTGMYALFAHNVFGAGYDYRETVAPWFRGLFLLDPQGEEMATAPLIFQVHALSAMVLYALWPFSRLVHAWSIPARYLTRAPILYRKRSSMPAAQEPR